VIVVECEEESAEATNKPKSGDKNLTFASSIKTFAVLLKILHVGGLLARSLSILSKKLVS
jgi:hypothetical protein